ncbi:MAG: hypothetical protein LBE20_02615 [Deltaproteobacteria bacterium]|jgi:hypothetical protein|nr:hypothetical protein [Deltaproteobacteria bacterium]
MLNNKYKIYVILTLVILNLMTIKTADADKNTDDFKAAVAFTGMIQYNVAPGVKLVAVDNLPYNTVQYTYVLERFTKNSPELKNISKNLKAALIEDLKSRDDVEVLRENKINLVYLYKDKANKEILKIPLNYNEY